MHHPQRIARLLQVGEAEIPGSVLWIDHVADPECERLAPDYYLVAGIYGQRTDPRLPPGVAYVIAVVEAVEEMAKAGWTRAAIDGFASPSVCGVVGTVERVRRFIDKPFAYEERIVVVE